MCDCSNQRELIVEIASFLNIDDGGFEKLPRENLATRRGESSVGPGVRRQLKNIFSKKYTARDESLIRNEVNEALRVSGIPESEWRSDGLS